MNLMVPTVMVEAIAARNFKWGDNTIKVGEILPLPYGTALLMRTLGLLGGFRNEDDKHLEAQELLAIYGGDSWFPAHLQTVSRVADYLAQVGAQEKNGVH
jgi:hypothetical protein